MATLAAAAPWFGLGVSTVIQIAAGNPYNFPLYSNSFNTTLGFNTSDIANLGVASDFGENFGIPAGLVVNCVEPWVLVLIGSLACFFGYGVIWLTLTKIVVSMSFWPLGLALFVATNSSSWFTTAVLVTNMRNFPHSRGIVAGILKGYGGLSAALYTEVYRVMGSCSDLLMFLTVGVPIICLVITYFVKPCTPVSGNDPSEKCYFHIIQASSVLLVVCVLITTILDDNHSLSTPVAYFAQLVMVLCLMAPLAIPVKIFYSSFNHSESTLPGGDGSNLEAPLIQQNESGPTSRVHMPPPEGEGMVNRQRRPRLGEDFTFCEALMKADFWLLFLVYFVGVGSGAAVLNSLAQIGSAQSMEDTKFLLTAFSVGNFAGRLGGGMISDYFLRWQPRTIWMAFTQAAMMIIYALFPSCHDHTLLVPTGFLGVCYGFQFSIMVPTASELFGLQNFGMIFNIISLGNPLGAFLFSRVLLLEGYLCTERRPTETYKSPHCFRRMFYVLAVVCFFGTILSTVLTVRIKPVYKRLYPGGSSPESSSNSERQPEISH